VLTPDTLQSSVPLEVRFSPGSISSLTLTQSGLSTATAGHWFQC
jgi:hypothetical protein